MVSKVDSLNIVSSTKPLSVVSKPENNSNIEVFENKSTKVNIDEVTISNANSNAELEEKVDNKKKWLISAGIAVGVVLTGILIKYAPKFIDKYDDLILKKYSDIDNPKLIEAFESNNYKQMKLLEGMTPKEIRTLKLSLSEDEMTFFPTITGYKPACIIGDNGNLSFISKIKDNPVFGQSFDFCTTATGSSFIFNKEKVLEVIARNKEIYTSRLGLSKTSHIEDVYNTLMKNKTEIFECSYKGKYQDIVGLTLGFPQKSTIIFQLENMANINIALRDNPQKYKETLLKVLHSNDSPYKNLSKESFKELEEVIKNYKPINIETTTYYPYMAFVNEPIEFARIDRATTDFINNFSIKNLF